MLRPLHIAISFAVLIGTGFLTGRWSQRETAAPEHRAAAMTLSDIPMTLGVWQGQAIEGESSRAPVKTTSSITRRYYNRSSDRTVSLLLVCGRPGPVSVHPPEVCYSGAGYEQAATAVKCTIEPASGSQLGELWMARFQKPASIAPEQLRIYWAWNATGVWQASENPRLEFAGFPLLYKLYVVSEVRPGDEKRQEDPCIEFLRPLLPELKNRLFPVLDIPPKDNERRSTALLGSSAVPKAFAAKGALDVR